MAVPKDEKSGKWLAEAYIKGASKLQIQKEPPKVFLISSFMVCLQG